MRHTDLCRVTNSHYGTRQRQAQNRLWGLNRVNGDLIRILRNSLPWSLPILRDYWDCVLPCPSPVMQSSAVPRGESECLTMHACMLHE